MMKQMFLLDVNITIINLTHIYDSHTLDRIYIELIVKADPTYKCQWQCASPK